MYGLAMVHAKKNPTNVPQQHLNTLRHSRHFSPTKSATLIGIQRQGFPNNQGNGEDWIEVYECCGE